MPTASPLSNGPNRVRQMAGSESSTKSHRGAYVRSAGSDLRRGDLAVSAGTLLGPAHVGLLASVNATRITVRPRPGVGVLSTGDELVCGTVPLELGQIRDSNRQGLLRGIAAGRLRRHRAWVFAAMTRRRSRRVFARGSKCCDALLTTGGVSVGEFDFVKSCPRSVGRRGRGPCPPVQGRDQTREAVVFRGRRRVRTGAWSRSSVSRATPSPRWSAIRSWLCPLSRELAGHRSPLPRRIPAVAADDFERRPDGKLHLLPRNSRNGCGRSAVIVRSAGEQGPHQLAALAAANALALVANSLGVTTEGAVQILLTGSLRVKMGADGGGVPGPLSGPRPCLEGAMHSARTLLLGA